MEDDDDEMLATAGVVVICAALLKLHAPKRRRMWVRDVYKKRPTLGEYHCLIQEMRLTDNESYFEYFRMTPERFDQLLGLVGPQLTKHSFRGVISAGERLALTIRYLASGDSQRSMSCRYRISQTAVSRIVRETCTALWRVLQPSYLKTPTENDWKMIEHDFWIKWNFPNCLGAIDGKHCVTHASKNSGLDSSDSIVLLVVVDANYIFRLISIGEQGSQCDGGVLTNSDFGIALENGTLHLPPPKPLIDGLLKPMPHVFVADEAFPLRTYIMRPFPVRNLSPTRAIFNYRLSRARRIVDNAFGILTSRWCCYRRPITGSVETVEGIVKATIVLHNFLKIHDAAESKSTGKYYCPTVFVDHEDSHGNIQNGQWRELVDTNGSLRQLKGIGSNMSSFDSRHIREQFSSFFESPAGSVDRQLKMMQCVSQK